jgi:hypothetical protein
MREMPLAADHRCARERSRQRSARAVGSGWLADSADRGRPDRTALIQAPPGGMMAGQSQLLL